MISVILLTYNRAELLPRAIESIFAQTLHDFEFIIVDNGSTDKSGMIADEYALRDDRIRVIHRERGNIGSGRNSGIDAAGGEYIAFVDDDDFAEPDFLEFLLNLVTENDAEVAICGAAGHEFDEMRVMTGEEALTELFWRQYYNVQFPTKLIKRKLFDGIRFSETSKYDDIDLMPKILSEANKIVYHGLAKYTFDRGHGHNNSAWTTNHKLLTAEILDEYLRVYRERTVWLSEKFPKSTLTWQYFEWSFIISMIEKIIRLGLDIDTGPMLEEMRTHRGEFLNGPNVQEFEKEWIEKYVR